MEPAPHKSLKKLSMCFSRLPLAGFFPTRFTQRVLVLLAEDQGLPVARPGSPGALAKRFRRASFRIPAPQAQDPHPEIPRQRS